MLLAGRMIKKSYHCRLNVKYAALHCKLGIFIRNH